MFHFETNENGNYNNSAKRYTGGDITFVWIPHWYIMSVFMVHGSLLVFKDVFFMEWFINRDDGPFVLDNDNDNCGPVIAVVRP